MSLKQFEKKSRGSLMRFIIGYLKTQSKKQVAIFAYALAKSKLPRLTIRQRKRKARGLIPTEDAWIARYMGGRKVPADYRNPYEEQKRKKKRKFSRKQLAAQRLFAKRARAGTLKRRRR